MSKSAQILKNARKGKNGKITCKARSGKYLDFGDLHKLSQFAKESGKKIVFTIGSFDLLNPGQCRYLADAKSSGDILVVGVSSDTSDKRIKGDNFPLIPEMIRAELLTYLRAVDYVTITENDRPYAGLVMLKPDIFFTCEYDWKCNIRTKQDQVLLDTYGGKIVKDPIYEPYFSASDLLNRIASIRFMQILGHYFTEKYPDIKFDFSGSLKPVTFGDQKPRNPLAFNSCELIATDSEISDISHKARQRGEKIVFVSGSFDLFHVGHARFIERASRFGSFLIVGIPSDEAVQKVKGDGRPIMSEQARAYVLASLDIVDAVVIFPGMSVLDILSNIKPDVFYTVDDVWNKGYKESPEYKFVNSYGGKVIRGAKQSSNISASGIIDKLAAEKVKEIFRDCMSREISENISREKPRIGRN